LKDIREEVVEIFATLPPVLPSDDKILMKEFFTKENYQPIIGNQEFEDNLTRLR